MKVGGTERPKLNPSKNVPLANTFNIAAPQRPSNHVVDEEAIKTWVYPTNIGVREYQYNIVSHCLFANTLVALPTGLGKTFIAAVVMYNFFRWFPEGRIVFMAPTKPLVAQQIEACHKIVGIPQSETEELTGSTSPDLRKLSWLRKRVFYLTPQVMQNDLQKETCPAEKVVLLVIDEAHRATGNHAYCEVIRELRKRNEHFRVLALTATPGSDTKTVQQVIENVLISRIEIRTEDSLDIKPYIHQRKLEIVTVALSQQILAIRGTLNGILKGYINRLCKAHAFYRSAPESVGRYELLMARDKWRAESRGKVASAMTLAQAIQLLMQHGIRTSYVHLNGYVEEAQKPNARVSRARMELLKNRNFQQVLSHIRKMMDAPDYCSHPKMERLVSLIIEHFVGCHEEANGKADDQSKVTDTRVMIFSQYRESVDEIRSTLEKHEPMIRVMTFVGQSAGGKGRKGFTQKEQLEVISKFQSGNYNVLVATSIGEEGLDIGEVDLIVCYDIQNSPIRMLQRIGRTGRKRQGKVALLLTEGKEEDAHRRSQAQYKTVQNAILDQQGKKLLMYPSEYCRMLPTGVRPKCVQKELDIVSY
ncbi:P-loop containing nucleoside triphosphate hydrolase protein, partial [Gaertneriomyces semiglobifer]